MKQRFTLLLLIAHIAGLFAQTENEVVFKFTHKAGAEPFRLHETVFPIWNNKKVVLNRAEFYLAEIELIRPDSSVVPLSDVYLLAGADYAGHTFPVGKWPVEEITGIRLHIGVDSAHNHLDPSTYPDGHPLGHQKNPMHWGWSFGYRFMAVEGFVDNNGDGVPESDMQFHNIGNDLYKSAQLSGLARASNGVLEIHIELDYARLFQDMSLSGSTIEHGNSDLNHLLTDNAATQGFMKLLNTTAAAEIETNSARIRLSPNPAAAIVQVGCDLPESGPLTLSVVNTFGQTVLTQQQIPASGATAIAVADLPNGVYQCVFYEQGRLIARKPLVVHH